MNRLRLSSRASCTWVCRPTQFFQVSYSCLSVAGAHSNSRELSKATQSSSHCDVSISGNYQLRADKARRDFFTPQFPKTSWQQPRPREEMGAVPRTDGEVVVQADTEARLYATASEAGM